MIDEAQDINRYEYLPIPGYAPFYTAARDLLFGYVGAFMYEGDSPLAERRAAALSVDPALLGELLGTVEMRELLDPDVIAQFEREAQRLDPQRRVRGVEGVADLLRMLGPLDAEEVALRLEGVATAAGDGAGHETSSAAPDHAAALLAEHAVVGARVREAGAQELLRARVHHRDDVEVGGLGAVHVHPRRPLAHDQVPRLDRRLHGQALQRLPLGGGHVER